MTFEVAPSALRTCARRLDDLATDCRTAFDYADHTRPPSTGLSAMGRFIEGSQGVRPAVKNFCHRLEQVSTISADELVAAARDYQGRDTASAARLDADYPVTASAPHDTGVGSGGGGGGSGSWGDEEDAPTTPLSGDPASALTEPVATQPTPDLVEQFCNLSDLFSLGSWALTAIDLMGGPNIPEEVGEHFAGDWESVSRSADAMRNLGTFSALAAMDVREGWWECRDRWRGNAATAAGGYFLDLADRVAAQQGPLDEIAGHVDETAGAVKAMAEAAGEGVEALADYAIAAGITLAAAATNWWNPVGWVGGAGAAYTIARGADTVLDIIETCELAYLACEGFEGLVAGVLASIEGFEDTPLPQGYDHLLVSP